MAEFAVWKSGQHQCGKHLSESLRLQGKPAPKYVAAFETCVACEALETAQREQAKKDPKDALTAGRRWQVYDEAEVAALQSQNRARR